MGTGIINDPNSDGRIASVMLGQEADGFSRSFVRIDKVRDGWYATFVGATRRDAAIGVNGAPVDIDHYASFPRLARLIHEPLYTLRMAQNRIEHYLRIGGHGRVLPK